MYQQVRTVPLFKWLFALATTLGIIAVVVAGAVYSTRASTAWLLLLGMTTLGLFIVGELRRQEWERERGRRLAQSELVELVVAAEHR